jgi:hypothetical protein
MGIASEHSMGFVYSISEDGRFKVSEINSGSVVTEHAPGKNGLKALIYSPERAVFIIADGDGFIYIYSANIVSRLTMKLQNIFFIAST